MPFTTTTIHALRKLTGGSLVSDIDAGFTALGDDIDPKLTPWGKGLLSARPVSTVGTPGKAGRRYFATDVGVFGCEYVDLGTSWRPTADLVKLDEVVRNTVGPITFSAIPNVFQSLRVVGEVTSSRAGFAQTGWKARLNGSSVAEYAHVGLTTGTTGTSVATGGSETFGYVGAIAAGAPGAFADSFTGVDMLFPGYSRADIAKTCKSSTFGMLTGLARFTDNLFEWGNLAKITSIVFDDDVDGGLAVGSRLALYGLV